MIASSLTDILLGCFVFFAFFAFIIAHMLLASKRIIEWFDNLRRHQEPPSVEATLLSMQGSADKEDANYRKARHARIESGDKHART